MIGYLLWEAKKKWVYYACAFTIPFLVILYLLSRYKIQFEGDMELITQMIKMDAIILGVFALAIIVGLLNRFLTTKNAELIGIYINKTELFVLEMTGVVIILIQGLLICLYLKMICEISNQWILTYLSSIFFLGALMIFSFIRIRSTYFSMGIIAFYSIFVVKLNNLEFLKAISIFDYNDYQASGIRFFLALMIVVFSCYRWGKNKIG